ncbi:MAG: hypothetical protein VYC34_08680, partial [Planctomycetota bacterium]|nr:hypothetical protein [Planctomycetota bacterium]
ASRIIIEGAESDTQITLDLAAMSDGEERSGRLAPENFDFDWLISAYRPRQVVDLDRGCAQQAYVSTDR